MSATINETCSCGATFTTVTGNSGAADASARRWREQHKHAESVGICGDQPPAWRADGVELPRFHCVLKAGHAGMHADAEGGSWRYELGAQMPTEEPR